MVDVLARRLRKRSRMPGQTGSPRASRSPRKHVAERADIAQNSSLWLSGTYLAARWAVDSAVCYPKKALNLRQMVLLYLVA